MYAPNYCRNRIMQVHSQLDLTPSTSKTAKLLAVDCIQFVVPKVCSYPQPANMTKSIGHCTAHVAWKIQCKLPVILTLGIQLVLLFMLLI